MKDLEKTRIENFNKFKRWRMKISKEKNIPPYMVLNNVTINNILDFSPSNLNDLKKIKGLAEIKIKQYGNDILEILKKSKEQNLMYEFYLSVYKLLELDKYISKKEVINLLKKYSTQHNILNTMLNVSKKELVSALKINESQYKFLYNFIKYTDDILERKNQKYIEKKLNVEKQYLDNILKDVDEDISLDLNQRKAILDDEDYTLIVAGAGSGKTTTIAAKVKYLVEKKKIKPEEILIVSFTNKAVNELKDRVNHQLKIPSEIHTFHKVGLNILKQFKNYEKLNLVQDGLMYNLIKKYLTDVISKNDALLRELILFFGYYIDGPPPSDKEQNILYTQRSSFSTLKGDIESINEDLISNKKKQKVSIKNEILRSQEEVQIANFLFLNGIEYAYEKKYPYHIKGSRKLYTPDFTIIYNNNEYYLEHFGISESGKNSRYSFYELEHYKDAIKNKIDLHKKHGTTLLQTYSSYNDKRNLLDHLRDLLIQNKIKFNPKSPKEIYNTLVKEDNSKYFSKLIFLLMKFISNFKVSGFSESDFDKFSRNIKNVRVQSFLKLCKPIYLYYQAYLTENNAMDFEDMINQSSLFLKNAKPDDLKTKYKYIIVDEYQDISRQRFNLTKALADLSKAKIVVVGDDWQSIYAFAGSQIQLFRNFRDQMGYANYLSIEHTYRNSQEIIDVAGSFIQKNNFQLAKSLKSKKRIRKPFVLFQYNDKNLKTKGVKGIIQEKAEKLDEIIDKIIKVEGLKSNICVLIRYNFEASQLERYTDLFSVNKGKLISTKHPKAKISIMTIHKSKGLGFDNVIVLNGSDGTFGFPSQIEIDPILSLVIYNDQSIKHAEERRLFYVAMTRTKNRCFIMYPESKPSIFVRELVEEYNDIILHGKIETSRTNKKQTKCPVCGYPIQYKNNKAYGLKLYMCTNEVEICGYMTNNLRSNKQSIEKCDSCNDGFMIFKSSKKDDDIFLGCTNYDRSGKGCNNTKKLLELK